MDKKWKKDTIRKKTTKKLEKIANKGVRKNEVIYKNGE